MKKSALRFLILLLALAMVAPSLMPVISLAADTSDEDEVSWDDLDKAYTTVPFNSVEERINGSDVISKMKLVLVSNGYALYNDPKTGEVICLKLAAPDENGEYRTIGGDGSIAYDYVGYYCTNPYMVGQSKTKNAEGKENDTSTSVKRTLLSQLLVKYTENLSGATFESYTHSAMYDQINIKNIRGGLRVEYTIGREETTYIVPRWIKFDKWMNLLVQIAENSTKPKDKRTFMAYYTLQATSIDQLTEWGEKFDRSKISVGTEEYLFMSRAEYNKKYPDNKQAFGMIAGVYSYYVSTMENKPQASIKTTLEKFPCTELFAIMVFEGNAKAAELRRVEQFIKLYTNYTKEQMEEDHAETGYEGSDKIPALFKLAIEYTIDEDGLYIRLNAGNIRFDSTNYKLDSITVLPYAGAANTNNRGYIFTPDGSGTIFDLQEIKGEQFKTTSSIYGQDYAYHTITGSNKEVMRFPVYGVAETVITTEEYTDIEIIINDQGEEEQIEVIKTREIEDYYGYLAVLTAGESLTKLTVENGGTLHMFASAYTTFNPRPSDTYILDSGISAGTDAMWTVESKRRYTGDYGIRIFILDGNDVSYSGMARVYRNYLTKQGALTDLEDDGNENIPLYLKTLGALLTTKTVLGVPVETTVPLTSFDNTVEILKELKKYNINNVKVLMEGWCNNGMWPLVPSGIELCDALGGSKSFKALLDYVKNTENGALQLFPNLDFVIAYWDELFDGFSPKEDTAKTIDDRTARFQYYDPVRQGYVRSGDVLISPTKMDSFYEKTYKDYSKLNVGGIAVSTLGSILTSDFNEDEPLNREDSKKIVTKLMTKIKQQNGKVLVSGGNAYVWPYVTDIIDIPVDDSRYKYTSASVPFYGMLLHGSKEYAGTSINLAGDYRYQLLKSIENGASPMFVVAYQNTAELKIYSGDSVLGGYYSVRYSIWLPDMLATYREMNNALKDVKYAKIVDHSFMDDYRKVPKVTYDNGVVFIINYLEKDYTVEYNGQKIVVPANGFVKTTVEEGVNNG